MQAYPVKENCYSVEEEVKFKEGINLSKDEVHQSKGLNIHVKPSHNYSQCEEDFKFKEEFKSGSHHGGYGGSGHGLEKHHGGYGGDHGLEKHHGGYGGHGLEKGHGGYGGGYGGHGLEKHHGGYGGGHGLEKQHGVYGGGYGGGHGPEKHHGGYGSHSESWSFEKDKHRDGYSSHGGKSGGGYGGYDGCGAPERVEEYHYYSHEQRRGRPLWETRSIKD